MSVTIKHVLAQGPGILALGRTAAGLVFKSKPTAPPVVPGPWLEETLPARPADLVNDFVRWTGGDPSWYRGRVPSQLFPQWGFPLAARTLVGLPYPFAKVMNAGCRIEQHALLPSGEPLLVRARLESIDDDGKRAIIKQTVITGTRSAPDAVVAEMRVFVPLAKPEAKNGKNGAPPAPKKPAPTVPLDVKELAYFRLGADAGLDFAKLTGDFNPIHWIPAYARASGFKNVILHGFGTLARALGAVSRNRLAGDVSRLDTVDVRFTAPLVLPARVGVYLGAAGGLFVGDAPGGRAYLEGTLTTKE